MTKFEILVFCVSFGLCVIHVVVDFVLARKNGKKLNKLCSKCGLPVYDDIEHKCFLSDHQLTALYDFVLSLRGGDNGNSK